MSKQKTIKNKNLTKAKFEKNDEFYTQYSDIEKELVHYKDQFKDKVVYCNCDDPRTSNFFKYFHNNFEDLGLKKLIASCFKTKAVSLLANKKTDKAIFVEYYGKGNGKLLAKNFKGEGDFRSKECIELLKQCDIVVTNPPFSLFREYVNQLIKYEKKFLVIGNQNAIASKVVAKLLINKQINLGYRNGAMQFLLPKEYIMSSEKGTIDLDGNKYVYVSYICWFTNLSTKKDFLQLTENYTQENYPKYDNYDAINVDKTKNIPVDYCGLIGVPISFLNKFNSEQFEIIDCISRYSFVYQTTEEIKGTYLCSINNKKTYARLIIKHKNLKT